MDCVSSFKASVSSCGGSGFLRLFLGFGEPARSRTFGLLAELLAEPVDFAGDGVPVVFFAATTPGNSSASSSVYSSCSLTCAAMSEVCSLTISCAWKKFKTGSAYLALKGVRMMPPRPKFSSIQWPSFSVCPALAKGARSWLIGPIEVHN